MLTAAEARAAGALAACVAGIYASYLTQGVVQEALATRAYGPGRERFPHLAALNAAQAWACAAWAAALLGARAAGRRARRWRRGSDDKGAGAADAAGVPPATAYLRPAATACVGPALGIAALRYIPYPAQVLAKSSKMIPVMLVGAALHGRRYAPAEVACCAAVSAGVALFALGRPPAAAVARLAAPNAPLGYALCAANLLLDGYTNAAQDEIARKYKKSSALRMMAWMNAWAGALHAAWLFGATRGGAELLAFVGRHGRAARDVALFCACGAAGQLFIFATIARFGSLTNTLVTTTRKFFNILLSAALGGGGLAPRQWAGVACVFGGLLANAGVKRAQGRRRDAGAKGAKAH